MANIKSAKKRIAVTQKRAAENKAYKAKTKTAITKFNKAVVGNDANATALHNQAVKLIDGAVTKGVSNKNAAARKKASLAKKLNSVK